MEEQYFEIYGKEEGKCPFCDKAKELLSSKGFHYEYILVDGKNVTKETLQDKVDSLGVDTKVSTVPQIFLIFPSGNVRYIGGFTELRSFLR